MLYRVLRSALLLALSLRVFAFAQPQEDQEANQHARQSYNLAREGRLLESEAEMREALRLSPDNPLYHSALAGVLIKDHKLSDAKTELETALRLNPQEPAQSRLLALLKQVDLQLGAQFAETGQYRDGMQTALDAAERFANDAPVLQMLGYFQGKLQLNRDAARSYSRALQLEPSSPEISAGLGMAQFSAGSEDEAVRTLEAGLSRFPNDANHYQALGVVLMRLSEEGRNTKARAQSLFEKALQLDATLPEAHYELGVAALAKGQLDSAKSHLQAAEHSAPNDSRIHFALARLYRLESNTEAAKNEMNSFLATKAAENSHGMGRIGVSAP